MGLIEIQQDAINAILSAPEQGKRACGYGMTTLNRKARTLHGIHNRFAQRVARLGFSAEQIEAQWADVRDMAKLEYAAECE